MPGWTDREKPNLPFSLRRRLLLGGALFLVLSMSAVGFVLDKAFAATTKRNIHERLINTAFLILAVIETDQDSLGLNQLLPDERLERPGSGLYAGVLTSDTEWRSHSSLTESFFQPRLLDAGQEQFAQQADEDGRFLLSMGLEWENEDGSVFPMTVWAAQSMDEFDQQMLSFRRALWPWLGSVSALIMAVQVVGMWLAIKPLKQVEAEVKAVESGQADRLEGQYPVELKPLTDNVNALLATERGNRERYQKALGDLAHSLKTPLAILQQSLAQERLQNAELDSARSAITDMRETISRQLERAVTAARRTHAKPIQVAPLLERLQQVLLKVYQERDIQIELHVTQETLFYGEERDFMEIAGNLMENACKYGNGVVVVTAEVREKHSRRPGLLLCVEDNGQGMSEDEFQRLQRRGERGDEQQEGQGLGLGIVAELVHAYDAQIRLQVSALGGAAIITEFPAL